MTEQTHTTNASQTPTVGMHATEQFLTDQVPYEVIAVPNAKTVIVRALTAKRTDKNGMSDAQAYEYVSNPDGETKTFTQRKCGKWIVRGVDVKQAGTRLVLGQARRFHDYSF